MNRQKKTNRQTGIYTEADQYRPIPMQTNGYTIQ